MEQTRMRVIARQCIDAQALGGAALPGRRALRAFSAVLAPAAGLQTRCAQTGRPLTTPLALRSSTTSQRQIISTQHLRGRQSHLMREKEKNTSREAMSHSSGWRRGAAFEASPEERSNAGAVEQKSALALFCAGVVSTAVVGTLVTDVQAGQLRPTLAR